MEAKANTFIYLLLDPRDNSKVYIGRSRNVKARFNKHISDDKLDSWTPTLKRTWIRSLLKQNLKPEIVIIDEAPNDEGNFWERHYVSLFKSWGFNLKNSTAGGDGSIIGNKTSFSKGLVPWNKGKTNYLSEEARIKMGWTRGLKGIKTNNKGGIPPNKGTKNSDEQKALTSKLTKEAMKNLPEEKKINMAKTQFKKGNYPARWKKRQAQLL